MNRIKFLVTLAGAALAFGASAASAQSSDQTGDQSQAFAAELSADAVAKTQNAAKSNGFTITDGSNKLRVGGFTQFRYNLNFRDNPSNTSSEHDSGFTNGFELPRTRLIFTGNVLDPNLSFKIEGQFSDGNEGKFDLLDAWGSYKLTDEFAVSWGQFQVPLMRSWYMSPFGVQGADYGVVTEVFSPGYSQGVWMTYRDDSIFGLLALDDGANSANTTYGSNGEADWGITGRLELKTAGDWDRFNEFASWKSDDGFAALIGAGVHWQHNGNTASPSEAGGVPQLHLIQWTIDASLEFGGANLFAAFHHRHVDNDDNGSGSNDSSTDDFGLEVSGGVFLADQDELFARWDWVIPDDDRTSGSNNEDDDFHALTFGYNRYFLPDSNAAKFTAELGWFLNEVNQNTLVSSNSAATGLLPDSEDNQILIRFQFQLAF